MAYTCVHLPQIISAYVAKSQSTSAVGRPTYRKGKHQTRSQVPLSQQGLLHSSTVLTDANVISLVLCLISLDICLKHSVAQPKQQLGKVQNDGLW